MEKIFTNEFLKEIGYERIKIKHSDQYGKAIEIRTNGMTILEWNYDGYPFNYFREPLEPNIALGIMKDGGTRTAFNGYVFTGEDVKNLLKLTL